MREQVGDHPADVGEINLVIDVPRKLALQPKHWSPCRVNLQLCDVIAGSPVALEGVHGIFDKIS